MHSEFHPIHDFFSLSSIGYAPTKTITVSYKAVMQVSNTAKVDIKTRDLTFKFNWKMYEIIADVILAVSKLPACDKAPDNVVNNKLFKFIKRLGYNGEITII